MAYSIQELDATAFVKVRGLTDARQMFLTWRGSIYSFVPNDPQKHLFNIVGMSVGRFIHNQDGSWYLTSRELSYYLDPITDSPLRTWENPWTGERLTVFLIYPNCFRRKLILVCLCIKMLLRQN
jgi:hypothetical protein